MTDSEWLEYWLSRAPELTEGALDEIHVLLTSEEESE